MNAKIGLFGGTFDPPHLGHLITAQSLAEKLNLSKVIFIPSGVPPHKKNYPITDHRHRLKMLQIAIEDNPIFEICTWELRQKPPTYTIRSIDHFKNIYPASELFWIIGMDNLLDLPNWFQFEKLIESVNIVTAFRGGTNLDEILTNLKKELSGDQFLKLRANIIPTPQIEISAKDIRDRAKEGKSLRYLVPPGVEDYIRIHGLYK